MKKIEDELMQELSQYGDVEVCKVDTCMLTLFMTGKDLLKGATALAILGFSSKTLPPSAIHVMKNSDTWLLLILKF